jgi:S1-C subfamily serine protease
MVRSVGRPFLACPFLPLTIFATLVQIGSAQSKSARQIAQEAFPSVALLVMQDSTGQPTSLGSGFVLRDGLVVTNRHVIAGSARGYARLVGKNAKYEVAGTAAVDEANDLAIVAVRGLKAPALLLADSGKVAVGDDAYAVGNPQGLEGTFSQGIVSAIRRMEGGVILQITAPISPGSSGGPILDNMGRVIGIAVATFTGGQNLNLAIPSSYLASLVEKITTEVLPLSRQSARPEKRSVLGELGGSGVEGVIGEHFEWDHPGDDFYGSYSLSLRNQLGDAVTNVNYLVVFLDAGGKPIDFRQPYPPDIPAGLAIRLKGDVDTSVRRLTRKVEIRVLDFRIGG